jgi:hypothetical protein
MENTYRFRFLIYLAAFMLVMSLCFVYAEPLPSRNSLLFQVTPQHAGFLAPLPAEPRFDSSALRATAPVVSPQTLQQLNKSRARHSFFHRARKNADSAFVVVNVPGESSVLVLTLQPSAISTAR